MKTAAERRRFIAELLVSVGATLHEKAEHMPPGWDGVELRHYVAMKFQEACFGQFDPARRRRFQNDIVTLNL